MKRRQIDSASGIVQRAMLWPLETNIFRVVRLYSKPSSLSPRETSSLNAEMTSDGMRARSGTVWYPPCLYKENTDTADAAERRIHAVNSNIFSNVHL